MPNLTTLDGGSVSVSEDAVAALGDALVGDLLTPESAEYDDARSLWNAIAPYATGEAYVNFMTEEEGDRLELAYGSGYQRLVELKNRYDPGNLFRMNQNIRPTV